MKEKIYYVCNELIHNTAIHLAYFEKQLSDSTILLCWLKYN